MLMMRDFKPNQRVTITDSMQARNTHGTRTMSTGKLNEVGETISERGCISVVVQQNGQIGAS